MRDQSTRPYNPSAARQTPPLGYAPPPGIGSDYIHHPLHRLYRRQIRWVRTRWLLAGFIVGGVSAFGLIVILSALVYTRIPALIQTFTGEPDLTVTISESFLNKEAAARIGAGYDTGVPGLTLRTVQANLGRENRMDFRGDFQLVAPIVGNVDFNALVKNQVTAQDGKLVLTMVGDPQIGNLNLPLNLLPFNLNDELKKAVNQVNNSLLINELNRPLEASISGSNLSVDGVTTDDTNMSIRLRQR